MYWKSSLILVGLAVLVQTSSQKARGPVITQCLYNKPSCSAETNEGKIDLKLVSTGNPYETTDTLTGQTFYWDPCVDFTKGSVTAGAIQRTSTSFYLDIGVHSSADCYAEDGYAKFYMYSAANARSTYVRCVCGDGVNFKFVQENPASNFHFNLTSDVCCFGGDASLTLSAGSIIVTVFVSLLLMYCVLGAVFQVAVRKAKGREIVPNVIMWTSMPGLIKDGFVFVFTRGRDQGYNNI